MSLDSENDYSIQDDSDFKNHSLCIEQDISKDTMNISLDYKNDYSIQVDSGSEHQTVDVKTFDYFPSNVALLQQGQLNCTQTTAIEKRFSLEEEFMLKFRSSNISTKVSYVGLNSETHPQVEGQVVVLTIR